MLLQFPESLDLPAILKDKGLGKYSKPLVLDKFLYVIDLLSRGRFHGEWDRYQPINAENLRKAIGQRYSEIVKRTLVELGIIETNGSYWASGDSRAYSTGYRLSRPFLRVQSRSVEVFDKKLVARIKGLKEDRIACVVRGNPALEHIKGSVEAITLDGEAARAFMEEDGKQGGPLQTRLYHLEAFETKEIYFSRDKQGRVHHNFAGMPDDLRQFATIDGQPLYSVDMSSLQPALLSLFYPSECPEKERYVSLIQSNQFYSFCNQLLARPFDMEDTKQKRKLKEKVFSNCLFNENKMKGDLRKAFEACFPILGAELEKVKRGDHAKLPCMLQSIEAEIVIGQVIASLIRDYPHGRFISVHDCVVTTAEFVPIVERRMAEKFADRIGFAIPSKTKRVTAEGTALASV